MRFLADENVDAEWIRALVDDGHDVVTVASLTGLETSASDEEVLAAATAAGRVVLTADQSDFGEPPDDRHAGIVVVADVTRSGGEIQRGVTRLESAYPDLDGEVAYLSDWL